MIRGALRLLEIVKPWETSFRFASILLPRLGQKIIGASFHQERLSAYYGLLTWPDLIFPWPKGFAASPRVIGIRSWAQPSRAMS